MGGVVSQNTPVLKSGFSSIFTDQLTIGKSLSYSSVAAHVKQWDG